MRQTGGSNPWRLYALSNVGSLAALLTYPFLVEPSWTVGTQTQIWSGVFVILAALLLLHAWRDRKLASMLPEVPETDSPVTEDKPIRLYQRPLWLILPALASVLLLAATSHVCQDVAVIPFLWVIPLSLYLISFIITFDHDRWYIPWLWALPAVIVLAFTAALPRIPEHVELAHELRFLPKALLQLVPKTFDGDLKPNYIYELAWAFSAMFLGVMICHGELVRLKPSPRYLTQFYLLMSAGGAIGGLCVSLLAPRYFDDYTEWPLVLSILFGIAAIVLLRSLLTARFRWLGWPVALIMLPVIAAGGWLISRYAFEQDKRLVRARNFYGTISVEENYDDVNDTPYRLLYHGGIMHGMQKMGPEWQDVPESYYGKHTGVGMALSSVQTKPDAKVGVIGMGTATAGMYAKPGHTYRFYEINPEIVDFAHKHFTYLHDMQAKGAVVEEVVGDGRLALEREPSQQFDVLLLDAFSGDSVPVHLLTTEALAIYEKHMKPDGIIVFNITNRYLKLKSVLEKVAASRHWKTGFVATDEDGDQYSTDYILFTKNQAFLDTLPVMSEEDLSYYPHIEVPLWTDRYHNLFQILVTE
jgi:hypothetical protein